MGYAPSDPLSPSQQLGTWGGCPQLSSHPGPDVSRPCHQIGRVSGDTAFAPIRKSVFSSEAWERLAGALSTCPDSPAGKGEWKD